MYNSSSSWIKDEDTHFVSFKFLLIPQNGLQNDHYKRYSSYLFTERYIQSMAICVAARELKQIHKIFVEIKQDRQGRQVDNIRMIDQYDKILSPAPL